MDGENRNVLNQLAVKIGDNIDEINYNIQQIGRQPKLSNIYCSDLVADKGDSE